MTGRSRRSLLLSLGTAATAALAGCSGGDDAATDTPGATTGTPTPSPPQTPTTVPGTSPTATATPGTAPPETATETPDEFPVTGPSPDGVTAFDESLPGFVERWDLPGAAVAAMKDERLVFARGYGFAGPDATDPVRPGMLFRIGSLAKPITAVSVLDLVERGALSLDDRLVDVLSDLVPDEGPADPRVSDVTVRHLLRQTAGFDDRTIGFDPVFAPIRVAEAQGEDPPASAEATVEFALSRDLGFEPGAGFRYANVNYCILGRVVEAVTGTGYETHVRDRILGPLGASRTQIGATRRENLHEDEVRYLSHATVPSPFAGGDGERNEVPRPYGVGVLDEALDADGGWIASPVDLLRFVRGVDGRSGVSDVLDGETREAMLARPPIDQWEGATQYYGMGWYVSHAGPDPMLWHNGSMPGSYAFLTRFEGDDLTVAALFNGRSSDAQFGQFNGTAQQTVLQAIGAVDSWPDRDLFDRFS